MTAPLVLILLTPASCWARDYIHLKSGETLIGQIIERSDVGIFVEETSGRQEYYFWSEVHDITNDASQGMPAAAAETAPASAPVAMVNQQPLILDVVEGVTSVPVIAPAPAPGPVQGVTQAAHITQSTPISDMSYADGVAALDQYYRSQDRTALIDAARQLHHVIDDDPTAAAAHAALAMVYLEHSRRQDATYDTGGLARALAIAEAGRTQNPELAAVHRALVYVHMARHDVDAMRVHLARVRVLDPQDALTLLAVADTHRYAGQYAQALRYYAETIKAPATRPWIHATAHASSGAVHATQSQHTSAAVTAYRTATTLNPDSVDLWQSYARALEQDGQQQQAITAWETSVALRDTPAAQRALARLWLSMGQYDQAETRYRTAQDSEGLLTLSRAYRTAGRPDDATRVTRLALDLDPANVDAAYLIGMQALATRDWAAAHAAFNHVLSLDTTHASAYYGLGVIAKEQGKGRQAQLYFKKAVTYDRTHRKALRDLAQLLLDDVRTADAIPYLQQLARLTPGDPWVSYSLGYCLSQAGRTRDAAPHFRRLLKVDPHGEMAEPARKWLRDYASSAR
jgi:tetratricopeptide (TPR) repeat protein